MSPLVCHHFQRLLNRDENDRNQNNEEELVSVVPACNGPNENIIL